MTQPMQIQPANLNFLGPNLPNFQEGIICTLHMGYMILTLNSKNFSVEYNFLKSQLAPNCTF